MDIKLFKTQFEFMSAPDEILCWIGGVGCGKTWCLAWWVLQQCLDYPGNIGVVAAATNPQLRMSTIPTFREVFDLAGIEYEFSEWLGVFKFPNGSWFKAQSLDIPAAQLKGSTLGFLAVDEVDACPEEHIEKLIGRVRRLNASRLVRMTGNSPPPLHYLERWFLPECAARARKPLRGRLLQSSTYENFLLPEDYIRKLELQYPPGSIEHRRYVLGELGVPMEGQVYKEFGDHLFIDFNRVPWHDIIGYVNGLDLGFNHWTVFYRAAIDEQDNMYFFAEYAAQGQLLEDHVAGIVRLLNMDPAELHEDGTIYCDHDAQDRAELKRLGIRTVPAVKDDKSAGIDAVRNRMRRGGKERSGAVYFVRGATPRLLVEIPYYVWAPATETKSGKDEPVKKDDDACDAMRYTISGYDLERDEVELVPQESEQWV